MGFGDFVKKVKKYSDAQRKAKIKGYGEKTTELREKNKYLREKERSMRLERKINKSSSSFDGGSMFGGDKSSFSIGLSDTKKKRKWRM